MNKKTRVVNRKHKKAQERVKAKRKELASKAGTKRAKGD